jgi:hypothetical protein
VLQWEFLQEGLVERDNYEENLEEEKKIQQPEKNLDKSIDLMKKLTDFLGK